MSSNHARPAQHIILGVLDGLRARWTLEGVHVGGFGTDGGVALVVTQHHGDAPLGRFVREGAMQGTAVDHAAIARCEHHWDGVRDLLVGGWEFATVSE